MLGVTDLRPTLPVCSPGSSRVFGNSMQDAGLDELGLTRADSPASMGFGGSAHLSQGEALGNLTDLLCSSLIIGLQLARNYVEPINRAALRGPGGPA